MPFHRSGDVQWGIRNLDHFVYVRTVEFDCFRGETSAKLVRVKRSNPKLSGSDEADLLKEMAGGGFCQVHVFDIAFYEVPDEGIYCTVTNKAEQIQGADFYSMEYLQKHYPARVRVTLLAKGHVRFEL